MHSHKLIFFGLYPDRTRRLKMFQHSRFNERMLQLKTALLDLLDRLQLLVRNRFKENKVVTFCFLAVALLLPASILVSHHRTSSQLYVVYMDELELGTVEECRDIELFVDDLVEKCSNLYGLPLELVEDVTLKEQYRPNSAPDPEKVQRLIRQRATFSTDAYMITVDDKPFIPIAATTILDEALEEIMKLYTSNSGEESGTLLNVSIVEDFSLVEKTVSPEKLFSKDEVVTLLLVSSENGYNDPTEEQFTQGTPGFNGSHSLFNSPHQTERAYMSSLERPDENSQFQVMAAGMAENEITVSVKTVEELRVIESIPFETEEVDSYNLSVNQSEIITEGIEGEKEIVYLVTRENGVEIERTVVEETIISEPVEQVELIGKKPLSNVVGANVGGAMRFIWPVQGEGVVYPNQGFRPGHNGIDIHIAHGSNVLAAEAGLVWFTGFGGSQGNYIILRHSGYWTLYLHNSEHLVSKGDRVTRGQPIARVGATGRAYGPHLHFEVRVDDGTGEWHSWYQHQPVDPMRYLGRR